VGVDSELSEKTWVRKKGTGTVLKGASCVIGHLVEIFYLLITVPTVRI
jgi:hypothetical protein